MSIVMTGGGTGGHLAIIKAVKEHLQDEELIYIGSTKGQDKQWFENDDDFVYKYFLETRGVVNQGTLGKMKSLLMMTKATRQAIRILRKHKPKVIFSVGGFSAASTAFAAKILRIPLVIHEQNAALGSLNKFLKPYATAFISSYLNESPIKAYPIKHIFFENAHIRDKINTIIFLGGSQGAKAINTLALQMAAQLKERGIKIIHQAGQNNIDEVQKAYDELGIEAEVFGFTDRLADYMNEADFAVARSGASTLWELSATAVPTLFIPYPYAASDHQFYNAQFLVEKDLAWIMREKEIDVQKVLALLDENLQERSKGLMKIVEKNGSEKIAELLTRI
ncbi:undecaprenyldiphospho-muramoylpentapeptide beta-N-acetylglucosaminyltransferase [Sulfurovum sp.]|uniref:undecaprenyldiphospho-muramoylpentapeptide beta-N-acetylglucosaminyltransferase n=1 Tax=Sulfurovum sp. TaxID=1969726 RepID=UPI002867BF7D|nr:undecaprenyldiphospho-muramoylpentapeptide beta-N-acetylglucosaminyltransferase [Sulfurovum sp.]